MRRHVVGLVLASFEMISTTMRAHGALDVAPFLKDLTHRDMTFDPGLPGLGRK
jgi:hypothetical protein